MFRRRDVPKPLLSTRRQEDSTSSSTGDNGDSKAHTSSSRDGAATDGSVDTTRKQVHVQKGSRHRSSSSSPRRSKSNTLAGNDKESGKDNKRSFAALRLELERDGCEDRIAQAVPVFRKLV